MPADKHQLCGPPSSVWFSTAVPTVVPALLVAHLTGLGHQGSIWTAPCKAPSCHRLQACPNLVLSLCCSHGFTCGSLCLDRELLLLAEDRPWRRAGTLCWVSKLVRDRQTDKEGEILHSDTALVCSESDYWGLSKPGSSTHQLRDLGHVT